MAWFTPQLGASFSPPSPLVIPREVRAWAEAEGATMIVPPVGRWNPGGVLARVASTRVRDGTLVRRVSALGSAMLPLAPVLVAIAAVALVWGPPAGLPLRIAVPFAVVLIGVASLILAVAATEWRAGPLLEVDGRRVRIPRLGRDLGIGTRLEPLVVRIEHAVRYKDGVLWERYCLPGVWHEGREGASAVLLPCPLRANAAERLARKVLDTPEFETVRVVAISSEEQRQESMPSGD